MTSLDDVPMLRQPPPSPSAERARRRRGAGIGGWPRIAPSRRTVLQGATAAGFAVLGIFPAAREAYADGYDIWTGACPSYAEDHNCSPGCGPSTVYADACVTAGSLAGFHKDDGVTWTLRPNQCYSGTYDGWLWAFNQSCGACGCGIERRCHDGYRNAGEAGWVRSICRFTTECGCPGSVTWPTIGQGWRGPDVYTIQFLLAFHGFPTTADGIFGPATEGEVVAFQESIGVAETGSVDAATWPELSVTVRQSDRNNAVSAAQWQLRKHGYELVVDGIFGPLTHDAVLAFQRLHGLTRDGIVGPRSWRELTGTA